MFKMALLIALTVTVIFIVLHAIQMKCMPVGAMKHASILITVFVASLLQTMLFRWLHSSGYLA